MYRRFAVFLSLSLCGLLAGCSSSPSAPEPANGSSPITVRAGTLESCKSPIAAAVPSGRAGTFRYLLAYAHVPPQPGAQPQVCLPLTVFRLVNGNGNVRLLQPIHMGRV